MTRFSVKTLLSKKMGSKRPPPPTYILSSIALITNAGVVIGLPLDITKIDAWNILGISLMFSKIVSITMITYLLMQITTYQENAESLTNR